MRCVVGLGNPGRRYARTLHNVGFMVIDRLAARWNVQLHEQGRALRIGKGIVSSVPVMLIEPLLYMNLSGESLRELGAACRAADLVVVYDDIDLPRGQLRVRSEGGAGGHRGVASVIEHFGRTFDRVRVGIGRPKPPLGVEQYVLAELDAEQLRTLAPLIERAADAVECILREGTAAAMNRFNPRPEEANATTVQ